ncbi:MAG: hypothetical protein ACE5DS_10275 [Kiloniellaceae bacterium]
MANFIFIADNTIPGLGASDLARLSSGGVTGAGDGRSARLRALCRALRGTDRHLLQDIGLDSDSR